MPALIHCPKCQFEQPNDRYCASCGIDMNNYKPPVKKKIPTGFLLYVSLFIFFAVGLIVLMNNNQQEKFKSQINLFPSQTKKSPPKYRKKTLSLKKITLPESNKQIVKPSTTIKKEVATSPKKEQTTSAIAPKITPSGITLHFLEIDRATFQAINDKVENEPQTLGDFRSTVVPQLSTLIQAGIKDLQIKIIHKITKRLNSETDQWFLGVEKTSRDYDIGLTTTLTYDSYSNFPVDGEIELLTSFYLNYDDAFPQKESFQETFSLKSKQGLLITGVLSPQKLQEDERDAYSQSILKIFQSEKFLSGESIFAITLTFHSN